MKVVLDVNVWVSGLLWGGVPGQVLELAKQRRFTVFASEGLLQELRTTLNYRKLQSRIQYRGLTVTYLLSVVEQLVELCPTNAIEVPQLRDRDDTIILAAAVAAQAEVVVTGDRDLLVLHPFSGISILTPQAFLDVYFPNN